MERPSPRKRPPAWPDRRLVVAAQAWLLDQFGVLHDGRKPYPGAVDACEPCIATMAVPASFACSSPSPTMHSCCCGSRLVVMGPPSGLLVWGRRAVERLAATGARLVLVSNSSKRAATTLSKLAPLGFDPAIFAGAITSGEMTHQKLLRRDDPWFANVGRRCIHFTWKDRGIISLEELNLAVVEDVRHADFLLAHGTEAMGIATASGGGVRPMALDDMKQVLAACARLATCKPLPLIIANPDLVTVEARDLRVMPGTLGKWYREMGGEVRCMGKPDPVVYAAAAEMTRVDSSQSIMVGDSLLHDIAGAAGAAMDSLFVVGGIHADALLRSNLRLGDDATMELGQLKGTFSVEALHRLIETEETPYPTYAVPYFTW
eukprot:SM000272S10266  [mRNA]  locus=s272:111177:113325:+ [translate_table: standard]